MTGLRYLLALTFLTTPAVGHAQGVVYDNGAPNNSFGLKLFYPFSAANDFTLQGTTALNYFDWYALFAGANGPDPVSATFHWAILTDEGGLPKRSLVEGDATNLSGALTTFGCCMPQPWEYQAYRFRTQLNGLTLGSGTYWLAISSFASSYSSDFRWANSSELHGNEAKRYDGTGWVTYPNEGAFTLYGGPGNDVNIVPEPASLILLATGLGGVGLARRRRKAPKV